MPFYTFKCEKCNYELTELRDMGDFKEPLCEDCGGEKMKKQLGTPNFQLKGGGWYKDGYSGNSNKPQISATSGGKQLKSYSSKQEAVDAAGKANEAEAKKRKQG